APEAVEPVTRPGRVPPSPQRVLLARGPATAPEAVEAVMAPALVPTKPPATLVPATVTLPLAWEPVMTPPAALDATSPPAVLPSPVRTLPVATDERIVPEWLPTKPPAWRLATLGLPIATDANEFEIEPVFTAASPPSVVNPLVPATPPTSPVADAFVM